jgi:hypothetical protein
LDAWKTILRLAVQWEFKAVKELALREINTPGQFQLPLVKRIILYQKFDAGQKYLEPLYAELLSRPASPTNLTLEEAKTLGLQTVLEVTSAREELRSSVAEALTTSDPLPSNMRDAVLKKVKAMLEPKPRQSDIVNGPFTGFQAFGPASGNLIN